MTSQISKLTNQDISFAIKGQSINFYYSSVQIFQDLDINVPHGSIYGLIGPSGCGKTTLFRSLLGQYRLNSGSIKIFGKSPGAFDSEVPGIDVGYMPQDIALDEDLTVSETLYFYGRLNGCSKEKIVNQTKNFEELLNIDDYEKLISSLSKGQQRRVSLACALIHHPKLVLLDEPTVGSDPMIVKKIWDYFIKCRDESGMTIVVSTHYLDEVKRADYFAFLFEGQILFEDQPDLFIKRTNAKSLEEAITVLYKRRRQSSSIETNQVAKSLHLPDSFSNFTSIKTETSKSYEHAALPSDVNQNSHRNVSRKSSKIFKIKWLLWRYANRWKRNVIYSILATLVLLIVDKVLLTVAYGAFPKDLKIGVINNDRSNFSLSYTYLNFLKQTELNWAIMEYDEESEPHLLVERKKISAYLIIGETFTQNLRQRAISEASMSTDAGITKNGRLTLIQDTSNRIIADAVIIALRQALRQTMDQIKNCSSDAEKNSIETSFIFVDPIFPGLPPFQSLIPATIVVANFFLLNAEVFASLNITLSVMRDLRANTFERLKASRVTQTDLLIALIIIASVLISFLNLFTYIFISTIFGWPFNIDWSYIILLIPALVLSGVVKGTLFGMLSSSAIMVAFTANGYAFTGAFISPCIWPSEALPYFMKCLQLLYGSAISSYSFERVLMYGENLTNSNVYLGLIGIWSHAIICLFVIIFLSKVTQ